MGVVTNKFRRFAEPLMSAMPFTPPAGTLVTPCDVKRAKPDPEAILLAAEQLGVALEQMVYVVITCATYKPVTPLAALLSLSATVTSKIMMIPDCGVRTFT